MAHHASDCLLKIPGCLWHVAGPSKALLKVILSCQEQPDIAETLLMRGKVTSAIDHQDPDETARPILGFPAFLFLSACASVWEQGKKAKS